MVKGRLSLRGEDRNVLESVNRKTDLMRSEMAAEKGSCSVSGGIGSNDSCKPRDAFRPTVKAREGRVGGYKECCDIRSELARCKVDFNEAGQVDWIDDIPSCPVYYPSKEEFADPLQYLESIAHEASKFGMCKIVSPVVVSVPAGIVLTKERANFKFTTRVQPTRLANWDVDDKITFPESGRIYSLVDYEKMANRAFTRKFSTAANLPSGFVEAEFWKELISGKSCYVEYACDVDGSAFSASDMDLLGQSKWNLNRFSRLSRSTLRHLEKPIAGVTEPMLYIGMLFSMFAWHVEDHYLYSINYHHCGAPKTWYGVPGHAASDFESVVQEHVYNSEMLKSEGKGAAYDLLIGKTTMFAPKLLSEHDVPVFRAVQRPGEFVITFPRAYHAGFSHGFNCGEAVNFATADWFPYGAAACWRYELLSRDPLLSHEELLCKEAMLIPQTLACPQDDDRQRCVKVAFLDMMRFQHKVQWLLKQQGAQTITSDVASVLCSICKHVCYVSYVTCKCNPEPMCLNHGREIHNCLCGYKRSLFTAVNLTELEAQACEFESEKGILSEVSKGPTIFDPSTTEIRSIEENMLKSDAYELYIPFCDGNIREKKSTGLPSNDLSLPNMGVQVEAAAHSDSPGDGKALHIGPSSEKSKGSESEQCRLLEGEEKLKSWSYPAVPEISCTVASLNGKQGEEEDESDSEAFRVKRRRVVPPGIRRLQVDSQEKKPKRLKVMLLQSETKHASEDWSRKGCEKEKDCAFLHEGHQVLVRDVIRELGLKGSMDEVMNLWQAKARNHGMKLKIKHVVEKSKKFDALSLKGCKCLKKLLPEAEKLKLENLMLQVSRNARPCKVEACGNAPPKHPCKKNRGNSFLASSLTCSLKSQTNMDEQTSVILPETGKMKEINKAHAADHCAKMEQRKETGLSQKKRKLHDGSLKTKTSDTCGEARQKSHVLSSVEASIQLHQVENLKEKKQKIICRNTESGDSFKRAYELVGSAKGTVSVGASVKNSDCQDENHTQNMGCLKVKGASPPALISDNVYKVKRVRSSLSVEREKEDVAWSVADKECSDCQQDKQISNQIYDDQYTDDGLPLPVEKDCFKQKCLQQVKKSRGISSSTADVNLKCREYPGKARTNTLSEFEPKKGFIIHLNRKVEPSSKSRISHAGEVEQEKEAASIATSNILDQGASVKPKLETARCPNQKVANSSPSQSVEGATMTDDSCFNHVAASRCIGLNGLNVLKDNVSATGKDWDKSGPPARNLLEGEPRESGIGVELADKESGKDLHEDPVHSGEIAPSSSLHDNESLFIEARKLKKYEEYGPSVPGSRERKPVSDFSPCHTDKSSNIKSTSSISRDFGLNTSSNDEKLKIWTAENIQKEVDSSCSLNTVIQCSSPSENINYPSHQGWHPQQEGVHFENAGEPSSGMFRSGETCSQWQPEDLATVQVRGHRLSNNSGPESENISRSGYENISVDSVHLKNAGSSCDQFYKGEFANKSPSFNSFTKSFNEVGEQTGVKLGLNSGQKTKTTPIGRAKTDAGWIVHGCERSGFCSEASPVALANNGKDMVPLIRGRTSSTVVTNDNRRGMYFSRPASSNVQYKQYASHYQRHHHSFVDNFRSFKHPASFYQTKERMPFASHIMRQQRPLTDGWGTGEVGTKGFPTVNSSKPVDSVFTNSTESGNYHYTDAYDFPAWGSSLSSRHWQYCPAQVQTPNTTSCGRRPYLHESPPLQASGQYNFEEVYGRQ